MTDTAVPTPAPAADHTFMQRMLDGIERLGNKMPNPAILFVWLCVGVIILSQILGWPLQPTIWGIGALVVLYVLLGGSRAVSVTQRHKLANDYNQGLQASIVPAQDGLALNVRF